MPTDNTPTEQAAMASTGESTASAQPTHFQGLTTLKRAKAHESEDASSHASTANAQQILASIKKFSNPLASPPRPCAEPTLQYDRAPDEADNFRSSDAYVLANDLNPVGWQHLHVSGSGSIASLAQVQRLKPSVDQPVTVLDVRAESHVVVGGYPCTWRAYKNWANVGLTHAEVMADEKKRIDDLKQKNTVEMFHRSDVKKQVENLRKVQLTWPEIQSEEEVVTKAGASYVRLSVTDHLAPLKEHIDAFVQMERRMKPNEKLHVHCGVGQGRTGIFVTLHDMIQNADKVSFNDIIKRQTAFNPGRALDIEKVLANKLLLGFRNDRREFVSLFYQYAKKNPKGHPLLWSEWLNAEIEQSHTQSSRDKT